jgi:hypothetical protein
MKLKMNIGPKKITRSVLEDKPRKKKKKVELFDLNDKPVKKKRKLDDADLKVRKKDKSGELTKSQSRELARAGGTALRTGKHTKLDKKTKKELKSYFGEHSTAIMDMLETGDQDGGLSILKKKLLQTVIRVLPKAEEVLNESGTSRGTYQFVTLVSQIRELVADIQADKDRAYIAQSILETIIRPAFMEIAQQMMTKHHDFRKTSEDYVKSQHAQAYSASLLSLAKDLAADMNVAYRDVSTKLVEALKT